MKKVLLIAAIAVSGLTASAQTEKGKIIVGGDVQFNSVKSDADGADAATSFSIMPRAGYFIANNFAVGTGLGYQLDKDTDGSKVGSFAVAPFGRYYTNLSEQFKFFGEVAVPLAFGNAKDADGNDEGSVNAFGVAVSPGFAFFPTKKIGIEFAFNGISFLSTTAKDADGNKVEGAGSSAFSFGPDFFAPQIGIQFHF